MGMSLSSIGTKAKQIASKSRDPEIVQLAKLVRDLADRVSSVETVADRAESKAERAGRN